MNLFESVIDYTLKNYSSDVFDDYTSNNPKLKDVVRNKIINDISKINKKISVVDFFIKGSILTKQYSKKSDIDVFVRVNTNLYTEEQLKRILKPIWEEIDNTYIKGVTYPFQYYITQESYNLENTEAAYDVKNNEWIKRMSSKNINIDEYYDDFKKYVEEFSDFSEELRRNMIDYEIIKDIPKEELNGLKEKLDKKLTEINNNIAKLADTYTELKDARNEAFSDKMTPSEIKKYGIKTRLPGNVVFKLIERYHYLDLYRKIKKIIGDDGILSHNEFESLNSILKTKLTNEKITFKSVFETKGRGDMQHKPRHRQQQTNAGLIGHGSRKSLNIVPDYQRNDGDKTTNKVNTAKLNSNIIRVKAGSSEAKKLAKKYRITNPIGKKIVGGNQYNNGITIIFEETIEQKIKRVKKHLNEL